MTEHLREASNAVEKSQEELATVEKRIKDAGIEITGRRSGSQLALGNDQVALQLKLGDMVETYFASRPAWYRVTSGAVHSAQWVLNSQVGESSLDGIRFDAKPDEIALAGVLSLEAAGLAEKTYAEYYGHDGADFLKRNRSRVRMLDVKSAEYISARRP